MAESGQLQFWSEPSEILNLTPNTPLIHNSFTYSKWNIDEIFDSKFHLPNTLESGINVAP